MSEENLHDLLNIEEEGTYARDIIIKDSNRIRRVDFDLKETDNFKEQGSIRLTRLSSSKNLIKRENIIYYGMMTGEEQIPIQATKGDVKLSLINKKQIKEKISKIKESDRKKIGYIHIATIQTIFKSLFIEGIDTGRSHRHRLHRYRQGI